MTMFIYGFLFALGWYLGKDVYQGIDRILDDVFYEKYEWYRNIKDSRDRK